jgi:purine-binding chemotaxis protein CheW
MESTQSAKAQYLTFCLAGEELAVGILQVREILEYQPLTRVPKAPAWVRGVMNLRGNVVPVIDLARKLTLPETQLTRWTCVVIVEATLDGERLTLGLLADTVSQVVELGPAEIEAPPSFGTRVRVDYLLGVGKLGDKLALLLDIDRVLSADEVLSLTPESVSEAAPAPEETAGEESA